ncbi:MULTISPECIES: hypothetical protein [Meiothermus]|uniref:Uncharacterized protein n=2 Tax=Meiothermus TaxID=65551 RepID=D3PRU4_MEIRD|nr:MULTISPECIES: hypothetical protein [Meiothermus]ADD28177.1 hypothetical protein Mrub_1415 [Meiothermus ruber DSM 1279]AGK04648.1 hypothetical protein K649_06740 [Meiothermus ruber DSM 1279]AWR86798.1 hypothetical protein Mtai_v1c15570 [Meiothermus taiwanensis WR-220]MCL6528889.1 hypothetical protein [Meiothermus ruber]
MDEKLNPLRLVLLTVLIGYFAFLFTRPQPEEPLVTQVPAPATTPAPTATTPAPANCLGQITQVAQGVNEIRLTITGSAERILVYTDQGNITAATPEVGSGGEYRIRTPGPATAVQLDDCPVLNLR